MVTKVAEEVEAEILEDSIHGMIEDMDIGLEEGVLVEEEEAEVVAEVDEEALAVHTDNLMIASHKMGISRLQ